MAFQGLFDEETMGDKELRRVTPEFAVLIDDISHRSDEDLRTRALGAGAVLGLLFLRDGMREGRYLISVAPNLSLPQLERRVQQMIPETEELVMTLAE